MLIYRRKTTVTPSHRGRTDQNPPEDRSNGCLAQPAPSVANHNIPTKRCGAVGIPRLQSCGGSQKFNDRVAYLLYRNEFSYANPDWELILHRFHARAYGRRTETEVILQKSLIHPGIRFSPFGG